MPGLQKAGDLMPVATAFF